VGTLNFESLNRATSRASVGSAALGAKDPDDAPRPPREKLTVSAEESVYSAILFLPSITRLKNNGKEWSSHARLALLLVIINAMLQMGVVFVLKVYDHSAARAETQQLIVPWELAEPTSSASKAAFKAKRQANQHAIWWHKKFLPPNERAELEAVESIKPLCERSGESSQLFECMPHSVKFVNEWKNLDTDHDGIWTRQEAQADWARLKEKYDISPETIFNNLINGLRSSHYFGSHLDGNRTFYLADVVNEERAIPKAYFDYWAGDAMMCTFFDSASCEAAAADGIFKNALVPGRLSAYTKGIYDLDSAIAYCYRMLNPGGGCETLLPTDFKRNREQRWNMCGVANLVEGGKYTNPYNADQSVHVLKASYETVNAYLRATSRLYLFFVSLIITLWLLSLIDELREIIKFGEFLIVFPGVEPGEDGGSMGKDKEGNKTYTITGITKLHRFILVVIYLLRVNVWLILTTFGTRFLLVETSFLDLVLNSLALTFILTIDSMLYSMVEKDVTNEMASAKDLQFETRLPSTGCLGYCLKKECWGLFLIPVLSVCVVIYSWMQTKMPMLEALNCACLQEGDRCLDSTLYTGDWWKNYYETVLPAAIHQMKALQMEAE
jgi:hypothetical protein